MFFLCACRIEPLPFGLQGSNNMEMDDDDLESLRQAALQTLGKNRNQRQVIYDVFLLSIYCACLVCCLVYKLSYYLIGKQ